MYINKIDELIDKTIDIFYNNLQNNDIVAKIDKNDNFADFHNEMNTIFNKIVIDVTIIKTIINNEDNIVKIVNIINKYIILYLFFFIAYKYKNTEDKYINNIIELKKKDKNNIGSLLNIDNIALIRKYYKIIKDIDLIINEDLSKINLSNYKDVIVFLNSLGNEFVVNNCKGREIINIHNIIKIIIFQEIYLKQEKKDVYLILDESEYDKLEFKYIDIIVPIKQYIDYTVIESLLKPEYVKKGYVKELYNLLINYTNGVYEEKQLSIDEKLNLLIKNKIIIPIVDDFLRYHKDFEESETDNKSKKNTKIQYIVTKTENMSEYYSENVKKNNNLKKDIENTFYLPLIHRKAILINDSEELKIINKIHNQGLNSIKNNEYYSDLATFRMYPYINFKDFEEYGYTQTIDKTIDVIRYCSLQNKQNNSLQMRIASKNMNINIVGYAFNLSKKSIYCKDLLDFINIKTQTFKIKDNNNKIIIENGYIATKKLLASKLLNNNLSKILYWIFNQTQDKIKNDNNIKFVISTLYHDIINIIYNNIYSILNKNKYINIYYIFKYLNLIQTKIFKIDQNTNTYNNLLKIIFYVKQKRIKIEYDYNEDKIPGTTGDIIKLPIFENKNNNNIPIISSKKKNNNLNVILDKYNNLDTICQHNLIWKELAKIRKTDLNLFSEKLINFIEKYLVENTEMEYVCKSCGVQILLKHYIPDGYLDSSSNQFITTQIRMDVSLENIKEYEYLSKSIKLMDKIIEKICVLINLTYFVGSSADAKSIRMNIIKNVIDLVVLHNKTLKNSDFKKRNDGINKKYGIVQSLTNLFFFELDDNIFTFSHTNQDNDKFKIIKYNNLIVYICLALIIELTDKQIINFKDNKMCNMSIFQKIGNKLFDKLSIITNNKLDQQEVTKYKVLSYILYYVSCILVNYKIWNSTDTQKSFPIIQKEFIHSLVDTLNSILEVNINSIKENNYIYKMFVTKYYIKLENEYSDIKIINSILNPNIIKKNIIVKNNKNNNSDYILLENLNDNYIYIEDGYRLFNDCKYLKTYMPMIQINRPNYKNMSFITNCVDGQFHLWETSGQQLKCAKCQIIYSNKKEEENKKEENKLGIKYNKKILTKLSTKYCYKSDYHVFNEKNICYKCEMSSDNLKNIDEKDVKNLIESINKIKLNNHNEQINIFKQIKITSDIKIEKHIQIIEKLFEKFKSIDKLSYIDQFINSIHLIIGKDININNNNIYTKFNIYIIEYDRFGNKINTPIIIKEIDNLFNKIANHSFFKKDIIYYTNKEDGNVQVFYDAYSLLYLGYKELNKEIVLMTNKNIYMKINYSIYNRLLQFGYNSNYINITDKINILKTNYDIDIDEEYIVSSIIADISRLRISRLKNILNTVNTIIYQVQSNIELKQSAKLDEILKNYRSKLVNMKIVKDNTYVFKYWKALYEHVFYKKSDIINMNLKSEYISTSEILNYDIQGNFILYYIISEMMHLLEINTEKFIKINIVNILIDLINYVYELYNVDIFKNADLEKFNMSLYSDEFLIDETKIKNEDNGLYGPYDEYMEEDEINNADKIEESIDDKERNDALDYEPDSRMADVVYSFMRDGFPEALGNFN
jgi:hypothetical protein